MAVMPVRIAELFCQIQSRLSRTLTMWAVRDADLTNLRPPRWLLGVSSAQSKRRRRNQLHLCVDRGAEYLENRRYLSATLPAIDTTPMTTTQVGADGSLYIRLGNSQNASAMHGQGGVALEGGGIDVDAAFQWMIGRMGGRGDFLVIRSTDDPGYNSYIYDMGGANSVATLVIPNRAAAMDPSVQKIIQSADAIFIGGGSQNEYLDWWQGTPVQQAIGAQDIARGVLNRRHQCRNGCALTVHQLGRIRQYPVASSPR